jgi:putative phage-type endonuclease
MEQGSDEWFAARLGKATASRISDVIAKPRSGNGISASRANYEAQLVCERLTGERAEEFSNKQMDRGIELEPQARAAYEFQTDNEVKEVGFIDHPRILMTGASPDGLIADDGITQIKCRNQAKHMAYLLYGKLSKAENTQIQWEMACTGREWCDFVNFHPGFPPEMQLFIKLVPRDAGLIKEMEREVQRFLDEVAGKVAKLTEKYGRTT